MTDRDGIEFIRRKDSQGRFYLVANQGADTIDGWVPVAAGAKTAALMDPMTGCVGKAAVRDGSNGGAAVYLQLDPGESAVVRVYPEQRLSGPAWPYLQTAGAPVELEGTWHVEFIEGGPELPGEFNTDRLASWTEFGDDAAKRFAGTARYELTFDAPGDEAESRLLDLGEVCHSARVELNGRDLGTLIQPPYRVPVDDLKRSGNTLVVEVTNLSANRIRDLDVRGVDWKRFHNINFVNLDYKPFDASDWPVRDSGLLGPVTLTPAEIVQPG